MEQFLLTAGGSCMGSLEGNKLPGRGRFSRLFYLLTVVFLGCGFMAAASTGNSPEKKIRPAASFTKVTRQASAKTGQPGVSCVSITAIDPNPTNSSSVHYTVTFSTGVTGVDASDFTVSGDSYGTVSVSPVSASVYTVTISGISDSGTIELDLNSSGTGITDLSSNPIIGGFTEGDIYTIDMDAPYANSGSFGTANATDPSFATLGDVVTFIFSTSETVQTPVMSFAGHSIPVTNLYNNVWQGNYTVTSSDPDGEMDFDLVITDLAGNVTEYNTDNTGLMVTVDKTPPTITLGAPSVSSTSNGPVTYHITYNDDNFNSATLSPSDITLNATGTATGTVSVLGAGQSYTVTISNVSGTGKLGISVAAGTAIDEAGNPAPAAGPSGTFNILPSSDATLSNIQVSAGALVPAFSSAHTSYTDQVINANSSINLTITPNNAGASIVVNGIPVTAGTPSSDIPLSVGTNTLNVVVTAGDGVTTDTYTLSVKRPLSNNAGLGSISLTPTASLVSTTGPGYLNYNATVANSVSSIQVKPTSADATATVTVNGTPVVSGALSQPITLPIGLTTITTVITAQDGTTTKTVIINVTRPLSSDATLSALSVSGATLSPAFVSTTASYSATVPYTTSSVTLTPITNFAGATVTVNGSAVTSGAASGTISLNAGANTITTVVTAQNGTTKTYTTTITRTAASTNALLNSIALSPTATLVSATGPGYLNFTATVANTVSSIQAVVTAKDPTATITVNGVAATSGVASSPVALTVGANTVTAVITAQDGVTTKSVIITVTRLPSTNALLSSIALSPTATLVGATGPGYLNFTASVANTVSSIQVIPTAQDATATITVNGVAATSGVASSPIALVVGANTITTVIKAQDGVTTKTVIVTVTRLPSNNALLASISVSPTATLVGATGPGYLNFTASVANTVSSIQVIATAKDPTATITVNGVAATSGVASSPVALPVGTTTITTVLTAQDGVTTKTVIITVTRPISSDATLSALTLNEATLSPAFASATTGYTATVPYTTTSATLTPTVNFPAATLTINGKPATSGAAATIPLNAGANIITMVVTAQNGATKTYAVTVTRTAASTNALLSSVSISPTATLVGVTGPGYLNFTASVANTVSSLQVIATAQDPTATITVNGVAATSGVASSPVALVVGTNTITTVITAQDGVTTKTVIMTITRLPSNNALLSSIAVSPTTTLVGATGPGYLNFTATVPNTVSSIQVIATPQDPNATVTVNGVAATSGVASSPIALPVGATTITTIIKAQDGVTTKTIIITVTRQLPADATLASLTATGATLSPSFVSTVASYTASVPYLTTSATLTPTLNDPHATLTINGKPATSGASTGPIALNVGVNTVTMVVTAQNGTTTKTYTASITRLAPSTNAQIASVSVLPKVSLVGATGPGYLNFTASVANTVNSMQVVITLKDSTATFTVNGVPATSGVASSPVALAVGANTITTVITAQDGVTTKSVIIVVTRAAGALMDSYYQPQQISVSKPADSLSMVDDGVRVHPALSPNGDGINDYLVIDGITNYPVNRLMIVDRNGNMVYQATGYDNSSRLFDGRSNDGHAQQAGTYFYSLEYTVNGEIRRKTGYIELRY